MNQCFNNLFLLGAGLTKANMITVIPQYMEALRDSTVNNAWLSVSLFRVQPFNPFTQMSSTITMPIGG